MTATAHPDTTQLEADLLALYNRSKTLPEEIDLAIVALNWGGWSQLSIATLVGVTEPEISRRVTRCGECASVVECWACATEDVPTADCVECNGEGWVGDPDFVTSDPAELSTLYAESKALPDEMDATMCALVDAGWSLADVGRVIGATKQAIGPRVKRHRDRHTDG